MTQFLTLEKKNYKSIKVGKIYGDIYYLDAQSIAGLDRMGKKSAENLIEAIEKSKLNKPDVVLMDLGLPDISGIEATKQIDFYQ